MYISAIKCDSSTKTQNCSIQIHHQAFTACPKADIFSSRDPKANVFFVESIPDLLLGHLSTLVYSRYFRYLNYICCLSTLAALQLVQLPEQRPQTTVPWCHLSWQICSPNHFSWGFWCEDENGALLKLWTGKNHHTMNFLAPEVLRHLVLIVSTSSHALPCLPIEYFSAVDSCTDWIYSMTPAHLQCPMLGS